MRTAAFLALAALAAPLAAQARPDFERDVLPILRERCFECHQAPVRDASGRLKKPKGGLRLDGRAWIQHGGDGGPALEPGSAEDSELWYRVSVPADDPDVMPEKGDPLTSRQIDVLRRWIDHGADFGAWVGAAGPAEQTAPEDAPAPVRLPARVQLYASLAEGLPRAPTGAIDRATDARARIAGVLGADRRLLRVSFPAHQEEVDDAALKALASLRDHVAELDLGRTAITDAAADAIARMPRLVKLDLSRTAFGDRGLRRLEELGELRSLNLFGARVTDAAVDTLAAMPALEVVYLWQSGVTPGGVERLQKARPALDVVLAPDLPTPPSQNPTEAPRRRR